MIRKLQATLIIISVIGAALPAAAQFTDEDKPSKYGIRVVNYVPFSSELRNLRADWMGPALDYHLKLDAVNRPTSFLTLGTVSTSNSANEKASMVQLAYTRLGRKAITPDKSSYMGFGAGLYMTKLKVVRQKPNSFPQFIDDSTFLPGVNAFYGREFGNAYFVEAQVNILPKWKGDNWSGIMLNLGTRVTL